MGEILQRNLIFEWPASHFKKFTTDTDPIRSLSRGSGLIFFYLKKKYNKIGCVHMECRHYKKGSRQLKKKNIE